MPVYHKICLVCQQSFTSTRADALYCPNVQTIRGKTVYSNCRSRSRRIPDEIKNTIKKRNSKYTMLATELVANTTDADGNPTAIGYIPKNATKENPLGDDYGLLLANAKMIKQEREDAIERERLRQKYSTNPHHLGQGNNTNNGNRNNNTDSTVSEHPVVNTIPTDDSGFGSKNPDPEMLAQQFELPDDMIPVLNVDDDTPQQQEPIQPKKYKFSGFKKQSA